MSTRLLQPYGMQIHRRMGPCRGHIVDGGEAYGITSSAWKRSASVSKNRKFFMISKSEVFKFRLQIAVEPAHVGDSAIRIDQEE